MPERTNSEPKLPRSSTLWVARVGLKEIMDPMADADRDDEASASAAKTQFINRFPDIPEMLAVYRRIGVHHWAIKVLSHDTTINGWSSS
jgi:hypothetical protein